MLGDSDAAELAAAAAPGPSPSFGWIDVAVAPVPPEAVGRWCVITLPIPPGEKERWPVIVFEDAAGLQVGGRHHLGRGRGGRRSVAGGRYRTIAFVRETAVRYRFSSKSGTSTPADRALRFQPISRLGAAARILAATSRDAPKLLRPLLAGDLRRARTTLVLLSAALHKPVEYGEWVQSFDQWPAATPAGARGGVTLAALVFDRAGGAAGAATLASLDAQSPRLPCVVLREASDWRAALGGLEAEYVAVLQAGEELPAHAGWFVAAELRRLGRPELAYGDEDRLDAEGRRGHPAFRPQPNRLLMLSGTQSRGVWFVRRDILLGAGVAADPGWAECLRLELWLRRFEAGAAGGARLPLVLTHRRPDAEEAPPSQLAAVVDAHLARTGMPLAARPGYPVQVQAAGEVRARVSILVPSRLRSALVLRCITSVLRDLQGEDVELVVGVSQASGLDAEQSAAARQIEALPGGRVVHLADDAFNFSRVCNRLAAMTDGEHVLLLNDDVSVIATGWLREMVALMGDPQTGIVGAKLLYPDRSVQHGGVIMGLSGLCDHAHRHLRAGDPGPEWRASLPQELSAVTAACMLVRRRGFEQVGGLDEGYPSAFNDVDLCLRMREAGWRVVYAPTAELIHHEMHTYGSHYAGERAPFEAEEIARLRRRWAPLVADDPFHNPNLDQAYGREWELSFPPRRPQTFQL